MNVLFKYLTFLILLGAQVFPQNIIRLKAKKEREKSKRTMLNVEETVEEISSADSLGINILDEETTDPLNINIVNEMKVDSLTIKKDKKSRKRPK